MNRERIMALRDKINANNLDIVTEEATKQWYVLPLLVALGYNIFTSDVYPEFIADIGVKTGEKVDYILQVNNKPVIMIECKKFKQKELEDKHISQLYRYFTVTDVKIGILTNGDSYWFFTDSEKPNVMDLKPYWSFKLSSITEDEINELSLYSKENILNLDISNHLKYNRFKSSCDSLISSLKENKLPPWLIDILMKQSGLDFYERSNVEKYIQASFNSDEIENKAAQKIDDKTILDDKFTWYSLTDYTFGDYRGRKLEGAIILGESFEIDTYKKLVEYTFRKLVNSNRITVQTVKEKIRLLHISSGRVLGSGMLYLNDFDISMFLGISGSQAIDIVFRLLKYANVNTSEIKVRFKD